MGPLPRQRERVALSVAKGRARAVLTLLLFTLAASAAHAEVIVTVDHNTGEAATPKFHFKNVAPPAADDAASRAKFVLVAGTLARNGAPLEALNDGKLPAVEDEPGANVFFGGDSWGGRFRVDFDRPVDVAQVNTYSWHPDTRAPQIYHLYGSDGSDPHFDAAPSSKLDPRCCGWKLIATVDTRSKEGESGGQYGVSIRDTSGSLGTFRYLLFDVFETESDDPWGNTFYSEIDVIERKP